MNKMSPIIGIKMMCFMVFSACLTIVPLSFSYGFVNDLRSSGFSLIPAPQQTELTGNKVVVDSSWRIASNLEVNSIVLKKIRNKVWDFYKIDFSGSENGEIIIEIEPGSVGSSLSPELAEQAYRLDIRPGKIVITGNAEAGVFYGVQSFLQLLKPMNNGRFILPEGTITDWPDLQLRIIHWDSKHHQDRIETLKRYIDQASYFKINAIAFEIADKYEYPSHPIIGAPGAFTKAQMQDLTAYAMEHFIQLIPDIQAPAHMAYVLKHDEFAHLRSDDSNYQICMCDEEAINIVLDLYQDMIDATPGVKYFLASTDEVYFAGICDKCEKEFNDINRSQMWVDYVRRINEFMTKRGREMISWVEYPLLPEDIHKLPSNMIDGVIRKMKEQNWVEEESKAGIRQLLYNSIQSAYLFPKYFPSRSKGVEIDGMLNDTFVSYAQNQSRGADLTGSFTAAWDDKGLHNELFWLGWVTGNQYSWSTGKPSLEQNIADFMDSFYGYDSPYMLEIYRLLDEGARFYENMWDNVISKERGPGYGDWFGKGKNTTRYDKTLKILPIPGIGKKPVFNENYYSKIEKAFLLKQENEKLINILMYSLSGVPRNHYNIEVMLSIAYLEGFTANTVLMWAEIENLLLEASSMESNYTKAVNKMVKAYNLAGNIVSKQKEVEMNIMTIWEKSRFKKGRSVNGRHFVHVLDDLKDHSADRWKGLEYMTAPFIRMNIRKWQKQLKNEINIFANIHNVEVSGLKGEPLNE